MKVKGSGRSIRDQLLATVVFVAVYPILLVILVGIFNYENVVKERFFDSAASEMALVSNYINQDVTDMNSYLIGLLSDQGLYELINEGDKIRTDLDLYEFKRDMDTYLRSAITAKEDFDVIAIYLYEGERFNWYAKRTGTVGADDIPYKAIDEVLQGRTLNTVYYDDENIYLGRKILDVDTLEEQGILLVRIDPEHLMTLVGSQGQKTISTNYLLTRGGDFVAYSGTGGHRDLIRSFELYSYSPGNYELTFGNDDYFVSISETDLLDFALIRLTTKDELLEDLQKVTDLVVILSVVNIPLYIFVGNILYRNITSPVETLVEGMNRFEAGQTDIHLDTTRNDEFGYMIQTFNRMTENTNKLINEVYMEELARKDAEISALQEQINPHFLYNTLESINWRAQLAGQNDIAKMIQALSVIMDGSINRNQEKEISLRNEVAYMDRYIFLIQMRFGDKIAYEKNFTEEALGCMVPKMIIQPLLENAVKHGIEPVGRGTIKFGAYVEEQLVILISDTGKGMNHTTKTMIRRIFKQEEKVKATKDRRRSIGLRNVARRLHLIYGDQVTIDVTSDSEKGTVFTIKLPIKKENGYET